MEELRTEFDNFIKEWQQKGYSYDTLYAWMKQRILDYDSSRVELPVKPEIAVLEKKIEGYKKIVQFIIDNHWKFGDMEQQLLTKIEKVGEKYDL